MFNPFEPGFFDDPYDQYRRVRAVEPVHQTPFGPFMLLGYDACFDLLRRPGTSVEDQNATGSFRDAILDAIPEERRQRGNRTILNLDPPDHTRLRKLVSKAFTPRTVERLRPRVEELVDNALDAMDPSDEVDLIAALAFPLPFQVISEMLGMPESDRDQLRTWSHLLTKGLEPLLDPAELPAMLDAGDKMNAHLDTVIEWKRANPADDLLSALLAVEDEGDVLTHDELREQVTLLYLAGHETTVNLIGNGTLALLRHRVELERLAADPGLDANAVDELLRFDSPVQFSRRIVLEEVELAGRTFEPGSFVMACLGSANHDPAHWGPTADELDLGRDGAAHHLSFGSGVHHCLGAALARLEGQAAIPRLIRRFPRIELAVDEPPWNGRLILRGLDALPVSLAG